MCRLLHTAIQQYLYTAAVVCEFASAALFCGTYQVVYSLHCREYQVTFRFCPSLIDLRSTGFFDENTRVNYYGGPYSVHCYGGP